VRLYELAERVYSGFGDYRAKMAATGGRRIPVFRLTPPVLVGSDPLL